MFVKKLIDKVSKKPSGSPGKGLRPEDLNPRLVFHYGVPAGSNSLAYDPVQKILAVSTKSGQIKLFGSDNTQALLESDEAVPSKFLQFFENQGVLLNVTTENHIEVWDIAKKQLSHVHIFQQEITAFLVMQQSPYLYAGDHFGNISVLKLEPETCHLTHMHYSIPFLESHGTRTEVADDNAVMFILPQPMAESKRVLIVFKDGTISLWGLQESKSMYVTSGITSNAVRVEPRNVVSACWACPFGSKVVVGYSNGEIFLWSVPKLLDLKSSMTTGQKDSCGAQNSPLLKLNLGYKMNKVPIVSLRWNFADGKASRLYVNGVSDHGSSDSFQVIILNEKTESRMIKLVLPLSEACQDMEIISNFGEQDKHRHNALVLLLKSGQLCIFDDSEIENYLLQCQSKSPPLPKQVKVKIPFGGSSITIAKFLVENSDQLGFRDEDHMFPANKFPCLLSVDPKDGNFLTSPRFSGFAKTNNLYITGHQDGSVNFWDVSCPLMLPILSIKPPKSEDGCSVIEVPVRALYFDLSSQVLVSGNQSGLVHIFMFKTAPSVTDNIFSVLQAKQGCNYTTQRVKLSGAIVSICMNPGSTRLAVGTDKGFLSVIEMDGATILYQKNFESDFLPGIISLQFKKVGLNEIEKNVLFVGVEDSSILALEEDTGILLSTNIIRPKNLSRALLMQALEANDTIPNHSLLLLCSEKSIRLYSLLHVIQGIKKVYNKKKLHGNCCRASTFHSHDSDCSLILLFAGGKIEIRSLPDLSLLKETSIRGLTYPSRQPSTKFDRTFCSSSDGEVIMVKGDQEIFFYSTLLRKDIYRHLESISEVYKRDVAVLQEGASSSIITHKERKTGLFGVVIRDMKGSKSKEKGSETEDSDEQAADISTLFLTYNFPPDADRGNNSILDNKDIELDIDDIDLEDPKEKHMGQNIANLNKQLGKKFNSIKGKLKIKTLKNADASAKEVQEDEKPISTVDEIKKRYGYLSTGESDISKLAENKLRENLTKLQGIGMRTTEMQNTARSFSAMAKELLRTAEQGRKDPNPATP